jgi:DNA-nicking Smr family endonuclease
MMKANSFQELKEIRQKLAQQRAVLPDLGNERFAQRTPGRYIPQRQNDQQRQQPVSFAHAVGPVQALGDAAVSRVHFTPDPIAPVPLQRQLDNQAVLRESITEQFNTGTLLEIDAEHGFHQPGVGAHVTARLRYGHWAVQREVDLHGLRREEAIYTLTIFLREATRTGIRCVRVVHGKGLGSPGREPVLKGLVLRWLSKRREVLAFVQAKPLDGGAGALVVLLAST